jgi:hypothetical protein
MRDGIIEDMKMSNILQSMRTLFFALAYGFLWKSLKSQDMSSKIDVATILATRFQRQA